MSWQSNQKTKKSFKEKALGNHITDYAFEPGPFPERRNGDVTVEGPYPRHTWYAQVSLDQDGIVQRVK